MGPAPQAVGVPAATEFVIGSNVACTDGACGVLTSVVVDPVARVLTHLVVESKHGRGLGHLVPIELATTVNATAIALSCTSADFDALEAAHATKFIPGVSGLWSYPAGRIVSWPYYPLTGAETGQGDRADAEGSNGLQAGPHTYLTDRVPPGDVEVRCGDHVHATDGAIGKVQGLVIDPSDHHVTHVLLQEGHLWGRKQVAIPIGAVASVNNGVRLTLTKDDVRDLPPIDLDTQTSTPDSR